MTQNKGIKHIAREKQLQAQKCPFFLHHEGWKNEYEASNLEKAVIENLSTRLGF